MEERNLPQGWIKTTLKEVIAPVRIHVQPKDAETLPYIGLEHVSSETMKLLGTTTTTDLKSNVLIFKKGDVLYGRLRPYLNKVLMVDFEGVCSPEFLVFSEGPNIKSKYIQYFLNSWKFKSFASHLVEGDRPRVDWNQLGTFPFLLPPLPEQKRIVAALEEKLTILDEAIVTLKKDKEKLKKARASVLKYAVEGKLTEAWRANNPDVETASELLTRVLAERRAKWESEQLAKMEANGKAPKDDRWKDGYREPMEPSVRDLPEIPGGWAWVTTEQLTDENRAITYGVVKLGEHINDGIPILRSSNVRHLNFETENIKLIAPEVANQYKRTFLQGKEIVITVRGTLGGVATVPENFAGYNISREVAMIACIFPSMAECLTVFIGSPFVQNWLTRHAKGIAYTGINIETLKETPLPLPPLAEQQQIVAAVDQRLSVLTQTETIIETNLKRAERARQSLLEQAFSGQLVPQNPNDEPASMLLERIQEERAKGAEGKKQSGKKVQSQSYKPQWQTVANKDHTREQQDVTPPAASEDLEELLHAQPVSLWD